MLKALDLLKTLRDDYIHGELDSDINEAITELEALETKDRLAELEKVILDYYLAKGYQVGVGGWGFKIKIETEYKDKKLIVQFRESYLHDYFNYFSLYGKETTKEMFDKAIEHFNMKR